MFYGLNYAFCALGEENVLVRAFAGKIDPETMKDLEGMEDFEDKFYDRKFELRVMMELNKRGLGEKVYGTFENGMCYG